MSANRDRFDGVVAREDRSTSWAKCSVCGWVLPVCCSERDGADDLGPYTVAPKCFRCCPSRKEVRFPANIGERKALRQDLKSYQCPACGTEEMSAGSRTCERCGYTGNWVPPGEVLTYKERKKLDEAPIILVRD